MITHSRAALALAARAVRSIARRPRHTTAQVVEFIGLALAVAGVESLAGTGAALITAALICLVLARGIES